VGSRYPREDKKKGICGYKRFLFPLIKQFCSSFHVVECSTRDSGARRGGSSSVSAQVVARVSAVEQRTAELDQRRVAAAFTSRFRVPSRREDPAVGRSGGE
jgi:hypothetical protein